MDPDGEKDRPFNSALSPDFGKYDIFAGSNVLADAPWGLRSIGYLLNTVNNACAWAFNAVANANEYSQDVVAAAMRVSKQELALSPLGGMTAVGAGLKILRNANGALQVVKEAKVAARFLKLLHSENAFSRKTLEGLRKLSNEELVKSLTTPGDQRLMVKPDGTVMQGNHRVKVLMERGYDTSKLIDKAEVWQPPENP